MKAYGWFGTLLFSVAAMVAAGCVYIAAAGAPQPPPPCEVPGQDCCPPPIETAVPVATGALPCPATPLPTDVATPCPLEVPGQDCCPPPIETVVPVATATLPCPATPLPTDVATPTPSPTPTGTATATETPCLLVSPGCQPPPPCPLSAECLALPGDVNCNGTVNAIDAALLLQFEAALTTSPPCATSADLDGDHAITTIDAALILQYAARVIDRLPPTRSYDGTVVSVHGLEADCLAINTGAAHWVLWDPTGLVLGQRIHVVGYLDPLASFCGLTPVLRNMSIVTVD